MKLGPRRIALLVVILLVVVSFLGGSAVWTLLGMTDDLRIEGRAEIVPGSPPARIGEGWPAYGGDHGANRYSSAAQITPDNVASLQIAWDFRANVSNQPWPERTAFEVTPILTEDALIFCTPLNEVVALDPASGEEKWRYDAQISRDIHPANQFVCRGVAQWRDPAAAVGAACATRIFMGTVDARLIALDAKTGEPCADFADAGQVRIDPGMDLIWPGEFQISSAPILVGGNVVVGSAISDNARVEAPLGTVRAFNARSGAPAWSFNPVPRNPNDPARASWAGNSADIVGHANVWSSMSVDEARGLIFLPTSSPSPDFFGGGRAGDNKYANSIVALNGETGARVWHFQTVHHDVWDYDIAAQPSLHSVWRDGALHDVVTVATKTGLVFVLDRDTGEPFLPIEERPAPQGGAEGEALSPTQPFPVSTPPIVPDRFDIDDTFGITLFDKMACQSALRGLRREGLFTPPSTQGTLLYPFTGGGANWGGGAFDPSRNLFVINMTSLGHVVRLHPQEQDHESVEALDHDAEFAPMTGAPFSMTRKTLLSPLGLPCTPTPWGVLAGVDLASGEIVWRRPLGTTRDLAPAGIALEFGVPNIGGPIITASGLVFIAAAMDDYLRAFDIETGAELWRGRLPAGGQATPMTYQWQGRQYVVIAAGGSGSMGTRQGDHIVAFALPD
jgi:quinoprotein glucose dehydrogenase